MNILHVIESSGGSADFVLSLIEHLPQHKHLVVHSARTFEGRFEKIKKEFSNVEFFHWHHAQREIRFVADLKAAYYLHKLLNKLPVNVIHLHSSKAGFIGRLVCFLQSKRDVIYTPNGLAFLRQDVSSLKTQIYVLLERIANWLNGEIVSCSRSEADALIQKGIKSKFINNGTKIFDNQAKVSKPGDSLTIATVGRVTIQKNPLLFNAIANHFADNPDFKFLWIGGGELESQLTSKNITVTGWLSRSSVLENVQRADIYISTALWEGLPFAVLEAMNLCKPMLLFNCVGNVDLVEPNVNGYLFPSLEDAIEKINMFNKKREMILAMGLKSHEIVSNKFNVQKMAEQYDEEYEKSFVKNNKK